MDVLEVLLDRPHDNGPPVAQDIVFVRDVQIEARIGPDAWGRDKIQPVIISAKLPFSIEKAGASDDIAQTLDYRTVYKAIRELSAPEDAKEAQLGSTVELSKRIAQLLKVEAGGQVYVEAPKALLQTEGILVRTDCTACPEEPGRINYHTGLAVKSMTIPCIIGIGEHERLQKQPVVVNFAVLASDINKMDKSMPEIFSSVFEVGNVQCS
jgi:FolB domain-containing protein